MADLSMVFDLLARDRASSEVKKVGDTMDRAGRSADGFGGMVGTAMKTAAVAVGALAVGAGYALTGFVSDAAESAKISRLTEAAIASTGGAANITADQIGELSTALSNKTAIDDEAIQSASNLLLTFTNVRNEAGAGNDIFNQATETALNMATAMGTDANGAAMQLGKALNDPIKGVSALGRAGVQFTADQKEQIATMVEAGDTLGAQRMILAELETQFGGAAAAAADPMARLGVIAGNVGEEIGGALLPYAEQFSTWLIDDGLPFVERLIEQFQTHLPPAIAFVVDAFTTARDVVQNDVVPALEAVFGFLQEHQTTVLVVAGLITGVLAAAFLVWGVRATVAAALNVAAWWSAAFAAQGSAAAQNLSAMQVVARWTLMGAQALLRAGLIAAVWLVQTAITTGALMLSWGIAAAAVIGGWVLMGLQSMLQAARMAAAWVLAMGPIGWVIAAVIGLVALIVANWDRVKAVTIGAFRALADAVENGIATAVRFVTGLPGKITGALGNLGSLLVSAGGDLLRGLWNGIESVSGWLRGKIMGWAGGLLPGWVKSILGISSPSKVFAAIGRDTMRGFAVGIDAGAAGAITAAAEAAAAVTAAGDPGNMGAGYRSTSLGYRPPQYDMDTAAGRGGGATSRTVYVSGVVGPDEVAAIVRREQATDEFLAGVR